MATEKFLLLEALIDFVYTISLVLIISGLLYYRRNGKKTFFFTYVLVAAIIFQLCMMLARVPLELGFAIGLFAIFGIIRYRTSPINPREMTYLLVSIGIAVSKQCHWCVAYHVHQALEAGATEEEIIETCLVATLMGGGPALMYAQLVFKAIEDFKS